MGYFLKSRSSGTATSSGTTAERPAVADKGFIRFNETTSRMEYYDGSAFRSIAPQGSTAVVLDTATGDGSQTAFTNFFTTAPVSYTHLTLPTKA